MYVTIYLHSNLTSCRHILHRVSKEREKGT